MDAGFRVEFYVKTGIVLLGASLPFTLIVWAGPVAILQAAIVSLRDLRRHLLRRRCGSVWTGAWRRRSARAARSAASPARSRSQGAVGARKAGCADRHHAGDLLGDRDDLPAAARVARARPAHGRGRRVDRHFRVCRRGGSCRGADLWRLCGHTCRASPGTPDAAADRLHADESHRPRRLDRNLGVRAVHHRDDALGERRRASQGRCRRDLAPLSEIRASDSCWPR